MIRFAAVALPLAILVSACQDSSDPSLEPAQNDALVPAMDIPTSENWGDELPTVPEGSRLPQ